jgi:putative membrane protein
VNPFLLTFLYYAVAIAVVIVGLVIFELMTKKYKDWDEIKGNNAAVALSIGGKIIGICIIITFSIFHNDTIVETIIWGLFGMVLQLIAYVLFEVLTRSFSVEEQLKQGNLAVGIVSFAVSVGLAFVIGASIS